MTGHDILKLASDLFLRHPSPSESLCRNIVGRAYYAAFHIAADFLASIGLSEVEVSGRHGPVQDWLIDSGEEKAKRAGNLLRDLYAARRRADYELSKRRAVEESRNREFVRSQVEIAETIKSLLESCEAEPRRTEFLNGINTLRKRAGHDKNPEEGNRQ